MMLMHHHRTEVDGHFDGLIAMRPELRAHRSTEEDQGFNWSHWSALSAGYSPHTAPTATTVFFVLQKMRWVQNGFDRTARDRPYHSPNASFVDAASSDILQREQSFNLSHCTLSEPNYKSVGESLHEAHQKMVAYMRPYPESC